jgi:hypothetical protein
MTAFLLFTSLYQSPTGLPRPPTDIPPVLAGLLFRFAANLGAEVSEGVPAQDDDPVQFWRNTGGSRHDAVQSTAARRPIFKVGGINDMPYLECVHAEEQFFEDIDFTQPAGLNTIDPYTIFAVTDAVTPGLEDFPALMGHATATNGGKAGHYFRSEAGQQIHARKSNARAGNVADPQLLMIAGGRNADGLTTTPHSRFWFRQNQVSILTTSSIPQNEITTAIAATQFLRNTALTSGGFFGGHIYEFLLYDGTMSNEQTFAVEDFLAEKYGFNS